MYGRIRETEHRGKTLHEIDLTGLGGEELLEHVEVITRDLVRWAENNNRGLLLILNISKVNLRSIKNENQRSNAIGEMIMPHLKGATVIGVNNVMRLILTPLIKISGFNISLQPDVESAREWLSSIQ